jgi:protein phosphatase
MGDHVGVELALPTPALVLLVGPSGAGKSTFARQHFRPSQVVSSDELRGRLADDSADQGATAEAFRILALLVEGRLRRRLMTVVDATNLRAVDRARLRAAADRYALPVVAVVFDLPADAYHANNSRRPDRRVERQVVERQLRLLRQALADIPAEGYAAVYVIGG